MRVCQTQLKLFLENPIDLVELAQREFSNQLNKSLNALQATMGAKNGSEKKS
jgi:hypothetical protein